jgi:hypothetical protein
LFGGIARRSAHADDTFLPKHFAEVNANPITFPESEDVMPTTVLPKTMSVNVTPALIKVQPDQDLIFTNDRHQFPEFEIKFLGASPGRPDDTLTGTDSVTIHVEKTGTFPYMIRHTPAADAAATGAAAPADLHTGVFNVRSCAGGCP